MDDVVQWLLGTGKGKVGEALEVRRHRVLCVSLT
jgi:hypothetical protein